MKEQQFREAAGNMADEVDRRIRKGDIDYSWMEDYFYQALRDAAELAANEERVKK